MRIHLQLLLAADEPTLHAGPCAGCSRPGNAAGSQEEALSHTDDGEVDIVVLGLNRSEDADLCWWIRERTTAPLLVLTEDGTAEAALARGLEWGADAYLEKPFTVRIF